MVCRSGCPTQDHVSWAACARDSGIRVAYTNSAAGKDATAQRKWDAELAAYRDAREQGVQPKSTSLKHTRKAMEMSEKTGVAFNATDTGSTIDALVGA